MVKKKKKAGVKRVKKSHRKKKVKQLTKEEKSNLELTRESEKMKREIELKRMSGGAHKKESVKNPVKKPVLNRVDLKISKLPSVLVVKKQPVVKPKIITRPRIIKPANNIINVADGRVAFLG